MIRDAQGLSSHLAAGIAQLAGCFHGIESFIEIDARRYVSLSSRATGAEQRDRIGRSNGAFQVRSKKIFHSRCVGYGARLNVVLETERVRIRTRGKQAVRKLKQAEDAIHL